MREPETVNDQRLYKSPEDVKRTLRHVYELNIKDAERLIEIFRNDPEPLKMAQEDLEKWRTKLEDFDRENPGLIPKKE